MSDLKTFLKVSQKLGYPNPSPDSLVIANSIDYTLNNLLEDLITEVGKEKSNEFYFDEYNDKKILEEYENEENDIITISVSNNVKPFQVISVLHRHKIIPSRSYARGYNKYKETDEYKNSLKKVA